MGTLPILLGYVKLILFPIPLSADHAIRSIASLSSLMFIIPFAAVIILLIIAFRVRRDEKEIVFGISFFFLALLPVYNIVPLTIPFAERYLYLPMAGIAIIASRLTGTSLRSSIFRNSVLIIILITITSINSLIVINRNGIWKNDKSLWTDTIKKSPGSHLAHDWMGSFYYSEGRLEEAVDEYKAAIKIKPRYPGAHTDLGIAYLDMGRVEDALYHLKEAIRLNPYSYESHFALGVAYDRLRQFDEAISHYTAAIELNPLSLKAHNDLGALYSDIGSFNEAIKHFKTAIILAPMDIKPRNNLADLYLKLGEYDKAIEEYREILKIDSSNSRIYNNIEIALKEKAGQMPRLK